jgi:CDGSH-type Zn-finger protein
VPHEATIVPYRDGPYLVRGPFALRDQNGEAIEARRATVALCRCGKSRTRPFCDGTHQLIRFSAPSQQEDRVQSPAGPSRDPVAATRDEPAQDVKRALARVRRGLDAVLSGGWNPVDSRRQLIAELRAAADGLERVGRAEEDVEERE